MRTSDLLTNIYHYINSSILTEQDGLAVKLWTVLRSFSVRISSRSPAIPNESFRILPQSLQTNSGIVPRLGHDPFLPNPFQFKSRGVRLSPLGTSASNWPTVPARMMDMENLLE
jgi:hypothetical protein